MDAISFVLGEKTSNLRTKKLSDLIHGAPVGMPASNKAYVTLVYEENDGTEIHFTRSIINSSSEYKINNEIVKLEDYAEVFKKLGILIKAKNFLVFQGAVEAIAMKNPKERTALFESISGSGELQDEYDKMKAEMIKAEEDTQFSYHKKKGIAAERKEAKLEKDEAEKYQRLKEQINEKRSEYKLFMAYHNEREITELSEIELVKRKRELERAENKRDKVENDLKERKKDFGRMTREITRFDQLAKEVDCELNRKRPAFIKAKEMSAHVLKKIEGAKKSLKQATKAHESHRDDIAQLEHELEEVNKKRNEYETLVQEESQETGEDSKLLASQVSEYHKLKEDAVKKATKYLQELDTVNREQKNDQDKLDNETRKKQELLAIIDQKKHELEENKRRIDKLNEFIKTSVQQIEEQKRLETQLSQEVEQAKSRLIEINTELENITEELGEAKIDKHENSRSIKKAELMENLKRLFPGVYGRLVDMCQPSHKKYQVAVTKVLGKNMDAIITDTEKTARECIKYMKEQRAEPETFLPLDYIEVSSLDEKLREIKDPKNVKLIFDVIQYEPPAIKKALLFACGSALVCETIEDARKIAFGGYQRQKSVSLDGTLFQKSGVISGGASDLKAKAKRWDEKQVSFLKNKKAKLHEEMRDALRIKRKESELGIIQSQIRGLETRLKYSYSDRDNTNNKNVKNCQVMLEQMNQKLVEFQPTIDDINEKMAVRELTITEIRDKMNTVEDEVFSDFCKVIKVDNIRQYEEKELRAQQEKANKRLEFENQKAKLQNQLEYEKSRDTLGKVSKWKEEVENGEAELETLKEEEKKHMQAIDEEMKKLENLKEEKAQKNSQLEDKEKELNDLRKKLNTCHKDITSNQKNFTNCENKIEQKKSERHSLLQNCKIEDIKLPLIKGKLEDIENDENASSSVNDSNDVSQGHASSHLSKSQKVYEKEAKIVIDYTFLPDELKDLDTREEIKRVGEIILRELAEKQLAMDRISAPNMKALEKLDCVRERFQETSEEFETARKRAKRAKQNFLRVKKERFDRFAECFEHVSNRIDDIYKALSRNASAQAFLGPENPEEPYLDGINYNCVAPGKRFRPMDNLSGGEKTIAALALLFGIHSYKPSPFFVLDEIDAALDNTNIGKVASYIKDQASMFQCIVISLKEEFYNRADALVGIFPEVGQCTESNILMLDLTEYPDTNQDKDSANNNYILTT
ncbi:unnamed protein product [Gordionus sp. m RMFG-2023]